MIDWDAELKGILSDPYFDDVKPLRSHATSNDRLVNSFLEVLEFVESTGREPSEKGDIEEQKLYRTLRSIRNDEAKRLACLPSDDAGLLSVKSKEELAHDDLTDIFNDPLFADVTPVDQSIFEIPE